MEPDIFVGRTEMLRDLDAAWRSVVEGAVHVVVLEGPRGSGRKTLVSRLMADTDAEPLPVRVDFFEGDDGFRAMLRIYGAMYTTLHDDATLQSSVRDHLETAVKRAKEPLRTWLQAFRSGMDNPKPDTSSLKFQVTVPRHSPYLGLVEIIGSLTSRHPIVLDLGRPDHVVSHTFWAFLTGLTAYAAREELPILIVLRQAPEADNPPDPKTYLPVKSYLENLPDSVGSSRLSLTPIARADIQAVLEARYPRNRFPDALSDWLMVRSQGYPGLLDDWLALLEARDILVEADDDTWILSETLPEDDWMQWLPPLPEDKHALARQVLQTAAMEGPTFTAAVVSDHLDVDKDDVDDLLDELEDTVREEVYHEGVQSWLYAFESNLIHQAYRDSLRAEARRELARALAELMEKRYVARSVEYACKAARLWLEAGEPGRHGSLMGLAFSADRADILLMGAEIVKRIEADYPPPLYKGLHLTLFEKGIGTIPVEVLREALDDVQAWAEAREDRDIVPWLALYRARLAHREGELADAKRLAAEARSGFARIRNPVKEGEALVTMAFVAQAARDGAGAVEYASRALRKTQFPPVRAQALFVLGVQHKLRGEIQRAVEVLREVLDLSAKTSQVTLHLDAGINIAECLMMGGKVPDAINLLKQLLDMADQTRQPARKHSAQSLLAKAHAANNDLPAALEVASAALKLARELRSRRLEAGDLLDLGIFALVQGQFDEALVYLREGEKIVRELKDARLLQETLFHLAMATTSVRDYPRALNIYQEVLKLTRDRKDVRREGNTLFNIAGIYLHQEDYSNARSYLRQAAPLIKKVGTPEEKKALKKALDKVELKFN